MISALLFFAVIYFKNLKTLRFSTLIKDNGFLSEWLANNRLLRPIAIMQSDRIKSPFAAGLIKPRIILPKSLDMNDKQLLNYVLTHEHYHIKRFDAFWKLLLLLAVCVHWFNPMMWIMFVLANRDLELTCDEAVIHRFGATTKKDYAYMLIGLAEQGGKFAPLYNSFSKNSIEERIVSIMTTKRKSFVSIALAVVIVATLTVGTLTVFAAENARSRLSAMLEEANVEIVPYEFRERLTIPDNDITHSRDIDPDVYAWIRENPLGTLFLTADPNYMFLDPEVYALIQAGAEWAVILDFLIERSIAHLQNNGVDIRRTTQTENVAPHGSVVPQGQTPPARDDIISRIAPVYDGLGRELANRVQPINGDILSQWDSNNPFAPIPVGEPIVPDADLPFCLEFGCAADSAVFVPVVPLGFAAAVSGLVLVTGVDCAVVSVGFAVVDSFDCPAPIGAFDVPLSASLAMISASNFCP